MEFPLAFPFPIVGNGIFISDSLSRNLGMEFAIPFPEVKKSFPPTPARTVIFYIGMNEFPVLLLKPKYLSQHLVPCRFESPPFSPLWFECQCNQAISGRHSLAPTNHTNSTNALNTQYMGRLPKKYVCFFIKGGGGSFPFKKIYVAIFL